MINLAYQEVDQSTVTLKNKYGNLENQMSNLKLQASPPKSYKPPAQAGEHETNEN